MTETIPAILLRVDGTWADVELATTDKAHDIRRLIGCRVFDYIGMDDMPGGADMWVDDEALLTGSPPNVLATFVLHQYAQSVGSILAQWIHGNVVVTGSDVDADTQGLQDITRQWLTAYLPAQ